MKALLTSLLISFLFLSFNAFTAEDDDNEKKPRFSRLQKARMKIKERIEAAEEEEKKKKAKNSEEEEEEEE